MISRDGADVLRVLFAFIPGAVVAALATVIAVTYYVAYLRIRRAAKEAGREFAWWGLLPRHVWQIGVSYLVLTAFALNHVVEDLARPLHWHLWVISVAFVLGASSLWDVLGHQRKVQETHRSLGTTTQ